MKQPMHSFLSNSYFFIIIIIRYTVNTNDYEPGELLCENMIFSHVKITHYLEVN